MHKTYRLVRNVAGLVTLPKGRKHEAKALTQEEQNLFIRGLLGERLRPAFLLTFATGMRCGELLGLRWQDVDLNEGVIQIKQTLSRIKTFSDSGQKTKLVFDTPKTEKSKRTIPLLDDVVKLLKEHKKTQVVERLKAGVLWQNNDLVICTETGTPQEPSNLQRVITRIIKDTAEAGGEYTAFFNAHYKTYICYKRFRKWHRFKSNARIIRAFLFVNDSGHLFPCTA